MQLQIKNKMIEDLNSEITKARTEVSEKDLKVQQMQFTVQNSVTDQRRRETETLNFENQIEELGSLLLHSNQEVTRLTNENISIKESAFKDMMETKQSYEQKFSEDIGGYQATIGELEVRNSLIMSYYKAFKNFLSTTVFIKLRYDNCAKICSQF